MENDKLKPCAYNEKLVRLKDVNDALTAQFMDSLLDSDRWVIGRIQFRINDIPTVDAVEVVRCKDCRHNAQPPDKGFAQCELDALIREPEFWCRAGDRMDGRREDGDT